MSSGCSIFRPNFWRPSTCTNCYQHRSKHHPAKDKDEMERKPNPKNRSELSQSGGSTCVKVPTEVVKPYAVVKIAEGQEPDRAQRGSRERWPRATALLCRLKPHSSRRKLVSPPPSPPRQASTEAKRCSVKKKANTLATDVPFTAERARSSYQSFAKLPPEKPPRTLSTFLTDSERDAFLDYANLPNNEVEEFPCVPATTTRVAYADSGQLHKEIADLISTTLRGIVAESIDKISCSENLWTLSDWSWVQRVAGSKVIYKGTALTVEEVTQSFETAEREMEVCRSLLPHPHLRLVRARLGTSPSTLLHSCGTLYFLKDHGEAIPLTYLLQDKRQLLTPGAYLHLVLTCLVQIFSAIAYLHLNGICHRNITMDTLCATPHGSEWLVAIGDLHKVLQKTLPIAGQRHMHNLSELKWSDISVAPPEVVTAPNHSSKTLDCSLVDSFALGCLIYNVMGEPHPFERNPRLLTQGYAHRDLLPFATDPASARSVTLLWLAQQLLAHDPRARMTAHTGLILCQALLWLPPEWFQEQVPARALQHYLAYEQAAMVSAVAKQRDTTLGNILKMQFLLDTSLNDLSHSLSLVWQR